MSNVLYYRTQLEERVPYFQTSERTEQIHLFISERVQKESFLQGIKERETSREAHLGNQG